MIATDQEEDQEEGSDADVPVDPSEETPGGSVPADVHAPDAGDIGEAKPEDGAAPAEGDPSASSPEEGAADLGQAPAAPAAV